MRSTHVQRSLPLRRRRARLALAGAVALLLTSWSAPALAGPPWISLELPVPPWPEPGAVFLVHGRHLGDADAELTATAEGLVDGQRRTLPLTLEPTGRAEVFRLEQQWPDRGRWALVLHGRAHGLEMTTVAVLEQPRPTRDRVFDATALGLRDVSIATHTGPPDQAAIEGLLTGVTALGDDAGAVGGCRRERASPWTLLCVLAALAGLLVWPVRRRRARGVRDMS